MAGGSANPLRQQMINMMYLVLTALLALNVSSDILKAFALVNEGLGGTNKSYRDKNTLTMSQFAQLYEQDQNKAQKYYTAAQEAQKKAQELSGYLQIQKEEIAKLSDGWKDNDTLHKNTVEDDKNTEIAAQIYIVQKRGDELKAKLDQFKVDMEKLTDGKLKIKMPTEDPPKDHDGTKRTWSEYYFEGVPSIAAITLLTKFQNDVRNAENEVINYNFSQVGKTDFKFDNLQAIVSSPTPSVYQGQKYQADIFLGAYSSTQSPDIYVDGQKLPVSNGKAHYEVTANGTGEKEMKVTIAVTDPATGEKKEYKETTKYQVFGGQATISADKMNMLYIGLDNPISVSVPGFRPDQVQAGASSGAGWRSAGKPGQYFSKPDGSNRNVKINVSVKMADGSTKSMGSQEYRVRRVPKVEVLFGTRAGGPISRGELLTVSQVNAGLGESFAFEGLNYTVTNYTFVFAPKNGQAYFEPVNGNKISAGMMGKLQSARPGDLIILSDVKANGPAGSQIVPGPTLTVR